MNENDIKSLIELIRSGDLEEFSKKLSSAFEEAFKTSKGLSNDLQKEFQEIFEIIKNDKSAEEWIVGFSGGLDQLKERFTELIQDYVEQKDLTKEQEEIYAALLKTVERIEIKTAETLVSDEKLLKAARIKAGLMDELETGSMLVQKYTLRTLKGYSDMLDPLGQIGRIQKDLSQLTAEQARIYISGKMIQGMGQISNVFMKMVGSLATIKAEFNKLTTDTETYLDNVRVASKEVSGLTFEEAAANTKELINGMSQFTKLTEDTRTELLKTVSAMDKLGLSTQNQVMLLQMTTKSFGMSVAQAQNSLTRMQSFAEATGIPMSELNKNLGAVGTKLAAFGPAGYDKVFQSLSLAAKNLGIEMSKLLATTEGFTTFEGAASAAGQLNAVLGGNFVNSINLLDASMNNPIDAFVQLKEAMDASGKSFSDMSPAMQRYIASVLNMDVAEAQALFGQSLGSATSQMRVQAKQQEELNALAAKSTDAFKRLEIAFQKIVASPITQYLISFTEALVGAIEYLLELPIIGDGITAIITVIAGLAMTMAIVNKAVLVGTMGWQLMTLAIGENRAAKLLNWAADNRWLSRIGAWITAKTTQIGLIKAEAQAEREKAISGAASNTITGGGLAALAATAGPLTPVLFGIAAVILAIGAAVALTGLGIEFMAEGFATLLPVMVETGTSGWQVVGMLYAFIGAFSLFVAVMVSLAPFAIAAAEGIGAIGLAIGALAIGFVALMPYIERYMDKQIEMKKAEVEYANSLNQTSSNLSSFAASLEAIQLFNPFSELALGIAEIATELDKLDENKLKLLNASFSANVTTSPTGVPTNQLGAAAGQVEKIKAIQASNVAGVASDSMPSQIAIHLSGPFQLKNGDTIGEIAYDAIIKRETEKERGISTGRATYRNIPRGT
jgi:hypothetical protein